MLTRIASIHFAPVSADRSIYGGFYKIPAVTLNAEPAICEIEDKAQHDEGPYMLGEGGTQRVKLQYAVWGEVIAECLINEWTRSGLGMRDGCRPGIWIVRDKIALMREVALESGDKVKVPQVDVLGHQKYRPAAEMEQEVMWREDLERARNEDKAYAEFCFIQGNAMAAQFDGKLIPYMPKNYKFAAQQYGFEASWALKDSTKHMQACPMCSTTVMQGVIVCHKCLNVIDIPAYARFEARKKAAMLLAEQEELEEATRPRPRGHAMGLDRSEASEARI